MGSGRRRQPLGGVSICRRRKLTAAGARARSLSRQNREQFIDELRFRSGGIARPQMEKRLNGVIF